VLLYIELTSNFKLLKVNSTTNDKLDFSSKEFGNFIQLLVKWNLSDICTSDILCFSRQIYYKNVILPIFIKQGHQLLNQMVILHLHYEKMSIIVYQN
jgi:hypothetical protein